MFKLEYIWIDGTEPTPQLRSKTKVMEIYEVAQNGILMVHQQIKLKELIQIVF